MCDELSFYLCQQVKVNGLSFKLSQTSISLPAEIFRSKQPIKVVNVVYLTLSNIFQLGVGNLSLNEKWNKTKGANTTIVSSIVSPPPRNNLKSPVKIVLQNTDVSCTHNVCVCGGGGGFLNILVGCAARFVKIFFGGWGGGEKGVPALQGATSLVEVCAQ